MQSQEQQLNLSKLPYARDAAYNHKLWDYEDQCLPDTRVELRDIIRNWWDHEDPSSECIFWLNGMAGTGKSTISRTVASELAGKKRLAASFFFSRGQADISHAGLLSQPNLQTIYRSSGNLSQKPSRRILTSLNKGYVHSGSISFLIRLRMHQLNRYNWLL